MKKIISIFSLIFSHSLVFANVETPYPEEYMEFFGCGNKTQFTMSDKLIYQAEQQPYESANLLRDYRSSFNQYPEPIDISKAGWPKKEAAIAARDKYRKERERINEIFKQKEEAYCAAQKPNPILNYKDIEKLSIVDFGVKDIFNGHKTNRFYEPIPNFV